MYTNTCFCLMPIGRSSVDSHLVFCCKSGSRAYHVLPILPMQKISSIKTLINRTGGHRLIEYLTQKFRVHVQPLGTLCATGCFAFWAKPVQYTLKSTKRCHKAIRRMKNGKPIPFLRRFIFQEAYTVKRES